MIILFNKDEKSFTTLGNGILKDTISCIVIEELNGSFELEMEYPITGQHYSDIKLQKLILAKPNMYDNPQAFRIYNITKPLDGIITINAEHISYDMSGYTVKPFEGIDLHDTLDKIQNGTVLPSPFIFSTDKNVDTSMQIKNPYSQRSLLAGQEGSVLDTYRGEYKFDMFNVKLLNHRGTDRGLIIRYGKNMTELEQETSSEKIFTGIFPFYFATINETESTTELYYQETYIVSESRPLASNWLSLSNGGNALIPLIEDVAIQIKTEGEYYNAIYCFKRATIELGTLVQSFIRSSGTELSNDWLSTTEGGNALIPQENIIYKILSEGDFQNKNYIWTGTAYEHYSGDGFYYIPDPIPAPTLTRVSVITTEKEVYIDLSEDAETTDGIIFVEGEEETDPQRILTLDLSDKFSEEPTVEVLKGKAIDYLKNNNLKEIKESTTVSFVKLSDSPEYSIFAPLEKVELGDYISIIYEKLGVEAKLQVISTEFNVITEMYNEIELGTKSSTLTDSAITNGDSISSLTNDAKYTDQITVVNLITDNVTANYITAKNAVLSQAQIEELEVIRIRATGIIEATQADIDTLVAHLLVAENAEIRDVLTAGEIVVKGNITATSGVIGGCVIDADGNLIISTSITIGKNSYDEYVFQVDEDGNVTARSINITGGEITIGNDFKVDNVGKLVAKEAEIEGDITITSGSIQIGGYVGNYNFVVDEDGNVTIKSGSINIGEVWGEDENENPIIVGYNFSVDNNGDVVASSFQVDTRGSGGSVTIDNTGRLRAQNAEIIGDVVSESINVNTIVFNDHAIEMKVIEDGTFESQTVYFTASAFAQIEGGGTTSAIFCTVRASAILWYPRIIEVSVTCRLTGSGSTQIYSYPIPISAGSDTGSGGGFVLDRVSITTQSAWPSGVTETRGGGTYQMLTVNENFGPLYDMGGHNGYIDHRWTDVYAENGLIQTSDRRQKKDINYDISIYEKLFDLLKPVSYKFNTNNSNRTHLGFISQDIEQSMKELNINSIDFAGFIKALKTNSKTKSSEDITDDDYMYGIRYSELHAMEIQKIQKLDLGYKNVIDYILKLEKRIEKLENKKVIEES